ncbi:M4 family metallopeptidase [Spongiactinospora sp. TRM90649]|uniref:M4 family metallopeptidase n=1 Tax=Spongiactinospora sp. TRM90649 TaxID=3031114 RepID=UPI0023F84091|nr:M4 family metallopeptidase [Spongiactinospora sp. TRM90649]MDF5755892.1 M4 family metallopeptidase [Spongiactinospora sp. TRM90649]
MRSTRRRAGAATIAVSAAMSVAVTAVPSAAWAGATADGPVRITARGYHNGQVQIDISESNGSYRMVDPTRPGLQCGGVNGQPLIFAKQPSPWPGNPSAEMFAACVDIMYGAQRNWDMQRDWMSRYGHNGSGRAIPARYDPNLTGPGGYLGGYIVFGRIRQGRPATPLDLVGREYGHVVFQNSPGGAGSGNENGGLNEGTADIIGTLTEHFAANPKDIPDYTIGEKVGDLVGGPYLRSMYNPSLRGDPNCYSASIPSTEVHAAAGPLNHWFYLLAEGSNPGGGKPDSPICIGDVPPVPGIGIRKAALVYMGALMRKTRGWRYTDARSSAAQSVLALYGGGGSECPAASAAWNAVTVPRGPGDPGCITPPTPPPSPISAP